MACALSNKLPDFPLFGEPLFIILDARNVFGRTASAFKRAERRTVSRAPTHNDNVQ
jgi:hypothetical protein